MARSNSAKTTAASTPSRSAAPWSPCPTWSVVDETRGDSFFAKLDLKSAYMQFRIREEDLFKTSFRVPGGQYEFWVGVFGLHCMLSILMQYVHSIFGCPVLSFDATGRALPGNCQPMPGSLVQVYCEDIL